MTNRQLGQFLLGLGVLAILFAAIHQIAGLRQGNGETSDLRVRVAYPPIPPGAGLTVKGHDVPITNVAVAKNGVAQLPNGIKVTLKFVYSAGFGPPAWDYANREVTSGFPLRKHEYTSPYRGQTIDRTIWCVIDSPVNIDGSLVTYVSAPDKPEIFHYVASPMPAPPKGPPSFHSGFGSSSFSQEFLPWRLGKKREQFGIGPHTNCPDLFYIPKSAHCDKITLRVGVGVGEWKSVLDLQNPFFRQAPGGDTIDPVAEFSMGDDLFTREPLGPSISLRGKKFKWPVPDQISPLIPRRALLLDSNGYSATERAEAYAYDSQSMSEAEIRRCLHIIIQESKMYWAEFRDIPIRPAVL